MTITFMTPFHFSFNRSAHRAARELTAPGSEFERSQDTTPLWLPRRARAVGPAVKRSLLRSLQAAGPGRLRASSVGSRRWRPIRCYRTGEGGFWQTRSMARLLAGHLCALSLPRLTSVNRSCECGARTATVVGQFAEPIGFRRGLLRGLRPEGRFVASAPLLPALEGP